VSRLRVAVVGTGQWAAQHARIFSRRPDTELVAVVGRDPARTSARAAAYGSTPYTDIDQMLGVARPDLVTVCLPNEAHFEPTLRLVRAGVPLLVEKPLVFDLKEADVLIQEAADRGLFFAINFNHRYAEPVLRAKAAIDRGSIDRPVFATWRYGGEATQGTSMHANLIETQGHGFDMLEHLVGPIVSVMAQMTDATYGDFSTVAIALEFESGAVGTMLGTYDSSYADPDAPLVEINGTGGRILIHDIVRERDIQESDESRDFHVTFDRHVEAVVAALRAGDPPPVPATAGRRALRLALAAIESFETGRRVGVSE